GILPREWSAFPGPVSGTACFSTLPPTLMDPAAEALQRRAPSGKVNYKALSDSTGVPISTLWHRNHGRVSVQERATHQQYLTPQDEKALVKILLDMLT